MPGRPRPPKGGSPPILRADRRTRLAQLEAALQAAASSAFEIDFKRRSFWCSPQFVDIAGRSLSFSEAADPVWPITHPDDVEAVRAEIADWSGRDGRLELEFRALTPSGPRWIEVLTEAQGRWLGGPRRIVGMLRDIDQRKRRELVAAARRETQTRAEGIRLAADAARAGVYEVDLEHGLFWCSEGFVEIVGRALTVEEAVGGWPMIHPEDAALLAQVVKGVTIGQTELRIRSPGGDFRWVDSRADVYSGPGGETRRIVGLVMDIDRRKRQEAALVEARQQARAYAERLKLATGAAKVATYEIDYVKGAFWCSPEFAEVVGRTLTFEEASGVWPMIHPDDVGNPLAAIDRSGPDGAAAMAPGGREFRIVLPSGDIRWVHASAELEQTAAGDPIKVVGLILDFDERKRQELALVQARQDAQRNAARLRLALTVARAGVFEIDYGARQFWCSKEFINLVGRSLTYEEATADCWPVIHPDDQADMRRAVAENVTKTGRAFTEARVVTPTGEVRWLQFCAETGAQGAGERDKLVGVALDIDYRKRQELDLVEAERAALAAVEAKSQFLANMSHEIRTPMNGVLGILHLLNQETLSAEARRMVAEAENSGQMLAQLLNDIVDFSKIEAGRLELSPVSTDVAATLNSVAELLRPQAEAKGVALVTRFEGDDTWAMVDPVRLRQALFNLIGNAVKFTARGEVHARLTLRDADASPRRLRFEVEDSGVGIAPAAQAALFQRFQQADGSTSRQFGGSGLGLAITRAIAQIMGGEVGFVSAEGKGSTFWFDVEAPQIERIANANASSGPSSGLNIDLSGLRILVVEDNPTNRLVATKILESLGASVQTAEDGVYGLEAIQAHPYDLVLMDVQMPRMDGVEATRQVRALPGQVSAIPIIGLTANAMSHQWAEYRDVGMDGIVSKPIAVPALIEEIDRVLFRPAAAWDGVVFQDEESPQRLPSSQRS